MFGFEFYDAFIIAGFLAIQYFLSMRNNLYWGAILPGIFAIWMTWSFASGRIDNFWLYVIILIIGLLFLLEQWHQSRISLKKKQEKELEKMEAHDLK